MNTRNLPLFIAVATALCFASCNSGGYFTQSLPVFQRKVYHPKGVVEADINLVNFFGS